MKHNSKHHLALLLFPIILFCQPVSAIDFVFNGFGSSSVSLYGSAVFESRILTLTNQTSFTIGRALYSEKIPTKAPNSSFVYPFSTSFIFAMAPYKNVLPGHGLVFLFVPFKGIEGASAAQHLGFLNLTNDRSPNNHMLGIEFDVFSNQEFNDMNANHVGLDVNSLTSIAAADAGYWADNSRSSSSNGNSSDDDGKSFKEQKLNNGKNYQVWIDYADSLINVTMAPAGMKRPSRPLLNVSLNLSEVFEDEMYVGFTASTGQLVQSHKILAWSFSNSNFKLSERLVTTGLPSFVLPKDPFFRSKGFISGATVGGVLLVVSAATIFWFFIKRRQRKARERAEMEDWELEYWPHRITCQEIEAATKGFSEENVIGIGGNGKVYKGVLPGGTEIAVKRISHENGGMREFLAEISSLGRLKHRSLVGLRGWCKKERGVFMLIYDYMENGSLEKRVFDSDQSKMLSCEERIRILKDVASALMYLHEGWESKVLHRDIKASNVLLDKDMNGRLGDFGLARVHGHGQVPSTTRVVGTIGYMAPEVIRSGRASAQTDMFGFGVLILEVMCGRRPLEEGKPPLVEWLWKLMMEGKLLHALDERLKARGDQFDEEEVERILHLGLLCAYPDPKVRPTIRQAVKVLEGKNEFNENEIEDMDTYLLKQMKSKDLWADYSQSSTCGSHPTFDEIRRYQSSSMSLSWTDTTMEGQAWKELNQKLAEPRFKSI
ncbi:PREDICTED: L-type lectin-domain containing receptor kinase VII.1-like isoform X1 [Populus euphratica]|uniref:non-specific serine/threonine protein kinase n=1 Tax=Populus euphratica TaxID=75702 RepID=A0AAJ6UE37_POPEU|nr:PREDICTED: L-type lectin-domain containing receptor kinase VII.1-like isoform X1 [Populus euphratica]